MTKRFFSIMLAVSMISLPFFVPLHVKAECTGSVSDCTGQKNTTDDTTAKDDSSNSAPIQVNSGGTLVAFFKLLFALIFVLFLIFILYRFVHRRTQAFQEEGQIKNIGGVAVGSNRSVQLIRVGQEILVVGVGEDVQLLKEINEPEKIDALLNQADFGSSSPKDLWQKLKDKWTIWLASRQLQEEGEQREKDQKGSFQNLLDENLKNMQKERERLFDAIKKED